MSADPDTFISIGEAAARLLVKLEQQIEDCHGQNTKHQTRLLDVGTSHGMFDECPSPVHRLMELLRRQWPAPACTEENQGAGLPR